MLPILRRLLREDREAGPRASHHATRALILAPTRELATQIDDEIQGFAYHAPIASAAVYGGVPMEPQERALKAGVDIVVATPGRLLDHMRSSVGDFSKLEVFVLDEADRMMDMGFWPDVRRIAETLPPTAVAPDDAVFGDDAGGSHAVCRRAGARRGVRAGGIAARTGADDHPRGPDAALAREGQLSRQVPARGRTSRLSSSSTRRSDATGWRASCRRWACAPQAIHADRSQKDRTDTIEAFRAGRVKVLVATDVAARGLDIEGIGLIVNYEVPHGLDSYVHRVGRTGRNDATGHALTLADPSERTGLHDIEKGFGLKLID